MTMPFDNDHYISCPPDCKVRHMEGDDTPTYDTTLDPCSPDFDFTSWSNS